VFVPVAFFPGTTGRLYQQFALTIAVSMVISAFNALTLTPALAALLLSKTEKPKGAFFRVFNRIVDSGTSGLVVMLRQLIRVRLLVALVFVGLLGATYWATRVPTGFRSRRDQAVFVLIRRRGRLARLHDEHREAGQQIMLKMPESAGCSPPAGSACAQRQLGIMFAAEGLHQRKGAGIRRRR
jgi:HAE1 family hydrophobic/amphiphilic exporter-1